MLAAKGAKPNSPSGISFKINLTRTGIVRDWTYWNLQNRILEEDKDLVKKYFESLKYQVYKLKKCLIN
jgi:hypothetical protein